MKRNLIIMGTVFLSIALIFTIGCAKKVVVRERAEQEKQVAAEKQSASGQESKQDMAAAARGETTRTSIAGAAPDAISQLGDIYFDFDKFNLKPQAQKTLQKYADWLAANPDYVVKIEGNCDERGTIEYNLALGERRAKAAMKYIVDLGIKKSRISVVSYGKERPVDPGHNEEAWAKNRRDHFVITLKK